MFRGGPCPPLYIRGDRVTWKVLAQYSWSPTTTQSGSFLCTITSSTPIRVVTTEVRYIHNLSLTLEHSMPISSPAALGLTPALSIFFLWTWAIFSFSFFLNTWTFMCPSFFFEYLDLHVSNFFHHAFLSMSFISFCIAYVVFLKMITWRE